MGGGGQRLLPAAAQIPNLSSERSLGEAGREKWSRSSIALSSDASNHKEDTDHGLSGPAWQAKERERERDGKRGQSIAEGHPVPGISLRAWQNLAEAERATWCQVSRQSGDARRLCGRSGVAHPYGAPLCSCSLSKSICRWWKGAPAHPLHTPLTHKGGVWR